jgi:hypothetical protein
MPPAATILLWLLGGLPAILLVAPGASAQENQNRSALREIREAANDICQSVPLEQSSEGTKLSGEAQARLNGLIGKVVDLGVKGAGEYDTRQSRGVLQQDLAEAIKGGNNCRLEVFRSLSDKLLGQKGGGTPEPPPPSASRPFTGRVRSATLSGPSRQDSVMLTLQLEITNAGPAPLRWAIRPTPQAKASTEGGLSFVNLYPSGTTAPFCATNSDPACERDATQMEEGSRRFTVQFWARVSTTKLCAFKNAKEIEINIPVFVINGRERKDIDIYGSPPVDDRITYGNC